MCLSLNQNNFNLHDKFPSTYPLFIFGFGGRFLLSLAPPKKKIKSGSHCIFGTWNADNGIQLPGKQDKYTMDPG